MQVMPNLPVPFLILLLLRLQLRSLGADLGVTYGITGAVFLTSAGMGDTVVVGSRIRSLLEVRITKLDALRQVTVTCQSWLSGIFIRVDLVTHACVPCV